MRFIYAIIAVVLLVAPHPWEADASEYFIPAPLEPQLANDGNALHNAMPLVVYLHNPNPYRALVRVPAPAKLLKAVESVTATFSVTYVAKEAQTSGVSLAIHFPRTLKPPLMLRPTSGQTSFSRPCR